MSKTTYTADDITTERNDVRRVQGDPSMYIGYVGSKGWKHCIKEIIHNSSDEMTNGFGDEIYAHFDEATQRAIIEDEGRGIPVEKLDEIFTILHSSGKKNKIKTDEVVDVNTSYGITAGVHGVGTTVTNALSAVLDCTVKRDGKKHHTRYENGKLVEPVNVVGKTKETGTRIEITPNVEFLEDVDLKAEELQEMIWLMSYLLPPGKKIKFHATQSETNMDINHVFYNKEGIIDLLKYKIKEYDAGTNTVIYFKDSDIGEVTNPDTGETESQTIQELEIAFTFSPKISEPVKISFANYCITSEGGTHVEGFEQAIASFFQSRVNEVLTDAEKKKIDKITYADVRQSLMSIVVCNHLKPRFDGQVKEQLINTDTTKFVKEATYKFLNEWVKTNQKELTKIISIIKYNAQSRVDGKKSRLLSMKKNIDETFFSDDLPEKFQPAIDKKHPHKELYLVEGDSAAGSVVQARFPEFQAINPVKGVPPNSIGMSLTTVMSKPELAGLVKIFKCGIGNTFDISKLEYDKIIILTDADNDGHKIASLLTLFFLFHLTPIVRAGKLYKVVPPLYEFEYDKKTQHITTRKEYVRFIETIFSDKYTVTQNGHEIKGEELADFLERNRYYVYSLEYAFRGSRINPLLLERVIFAYMQTGGDYKKMAKIIKSHFSMIDIELDEQSMFIRGSIDKEYQTTLINQKVLDKLGAIIDYIKDNGGGIDYEINGEAKTLYETMKLIENCEPADRTRFKGIGEMDPEELTTTAMNPNTRTLIQLTVEDLEEEFKAFRRLHGNDANERKKLLETFKLDREDIDN